MTAVVADELKNLVKVNNMNIEEIQENGYGVSALWDKEMFSRIDDIFYDIRRSRGVDRQLLLQNVIDPCIDIATGVHPNKIDSNLVPKLAHAGHNVITHPGIALTNKNITGEDMTRFLYIFSGTDNTQIPTIYSDGIQDENARMSILDTGFFYASGTALFQGCVFPTSIPDAQVKAFGSATVSDPDDPAHLVFWVMRILDPLKYINHFQNKTVYTHMHVIDRRSRLSE